MRSFAMLALALVFLAGPSFAQQVTILTPPGTKPVGDAASYGIGYEWHEVNEPYTISGASKSQAFDIW